MARHLRVFLDRPPRRTGANAGRRGRNRIEAPHIEIKEGRRERKTQAIVSPKEWEAAREKLLVREKAHTRARDALAAERRRMPWLAVEKTYAFDGPRGKVSLLDLFDGRRQLIIYRAF